MRSRSLASKKTRCEGITSIRRRCGFTSCLMWSREEIIVSLLLVRMHLFRQQHILIIALELFLYPPAAEAAAPEECAPRRIKEYGSMCLVTVRRSSGSRCACLPACRSLICVEASPVDEPDTTKYTQTLRCGVRRCIISFALQERSNNSCHVRFSFGLPAFMKLSSKICCCFQSNKNL